MRIIKCLIFLLFSLSLYGKGGEDGTSMPMMRQEMEKYYEEFDKMRKGMSEEEFRKVIIEELKYINTLNNSNLKVKRAPLGSKEMIWIEDTVTKRILKKRDKAFIYYIMDYTLYEKPDMEVVSLLEERKKKTPPNDFYFSSSFIRVGSFQYYAYMIRVRDMSVDERVDYLINEVINNHHKDPTKHAAALGALKSLKMIGAKGIKRLTDEFERYLKDVECSRRFCNGISVDMKSVIQVKGGPEDMDRLAEIVKKSDISKENKDTMLIWIEWGKKDPFPYRKHFGNYRFPYERFFKNYKEF